MLVFSINGEKLQLLTKCIQPFYFHTLKQGRGHGREISFEMIYFVDSREIIKFLKILLGLQLSLEGDKAEKSAKMHRLDAYL